MAERVLARLAGQLATGRAGLPADPRKAPFLEIFAEDFLRRREATHRAIASEKGRWKNHLKPAFGHLRPAEVTVAGIRAFLEAAQAKKLSGGTRHLCLTLLSAMFVELVEQGIAQANPCRGLPRSVRRLARPTYDSKLTPFVEKLEDVRRIYLALPEPLNIAYALGALGGLRTGEAFALRWVHVDLAARRIHVRESVGGPLKDEDSRIVPAPDSLLAVLKAWKLRTGGEGLVVPSKRSKRGHHLMYREGCHRKLERALKALDLEREGLGWYEATRHTYASHWVLAGGSIEKLSKVLGHSSITITERHYVHLRPEMFSERDANTVSVDLSPGRAVSSPIGPALGQAKTVVACK